MAQETRVKVGQKASIKVTESTTIVKKVVIGTPVRNVTQASFDATTLAGQPESFYRDFRNLTNVPGGGGTLLANIVDSTKGDDLGTKARGSLTVTGSIIPDSDRRYNLGTPSKRFGSLFIEGQTLFVGDLALGDGGTGSLQVQPVDQDANPTGAARTIATDIDSDVIIKTIDLWARGVDSTGQIQFVGSDSAQGYSTNAIPGLQTFFDSSYVQARISETFLDNLIDSDFVRRNLHGGKVQEIIRQTVDSAFVDLLQNPAGIKFSTSGDKNQFRTASQYLDSDRVLHPIRSTNFTGNLLRLELASFDPVLTATGQNLSWDQQCTQFTAAADNPTDVTTRFVNSVTQIEQLSGSVSTTLSNYNATNPNPTPAGGVDWSQTFSVDSDTHVRPISTNQVGGQASGRLTFADNNGTIVGSATFTSNWSSASVTTNFGSLTGNTFLQTYTTIPYTVSIGGLSDASNAAVVVSPTGGTISSTTGSGTFTFATPVHKNNNDGSRGLTTISTFSRPAAVTGSAYTVDVQAQDSSFSASFTYPSFRIFTASSATPPTRADIIQGTGYESTVTNLGHHVNSLTQTINNSTSGPLCMWFGVRSAISQPSSFQTGASSSLLSDVAKTDATVNLAPDTVPSGYNAEEFKLYGITLQAGNTYVSIT